MLLSKKQSPDATMNTQSEDDGTTDNKVDPALNNLLLPLRGSTRLRERQLKEEQDK